MFARRPRVGKKSGRHSEVEWGPSIEFAAGRRESDRRGDGPRWPGRCGASPPLNQFLILATCWGGRGAFLIPGGRGGGQNKKSLHRQLGGGGSLSSRLKTRRVGGANGPGDHLIASQAPSVATHNSSIRGSPPQRKGPLRRFDAESAEIRRRPVRPHRAEAFDGGSRRMQKSAVRRPGYIPNWRNCPRCVRARTGRGEP